MKKIYCFKYFSENKVKRRKKEEKKKKYYPGVVVDYHYYLKAKFEYFNLVM